MEQKRNDRAVFFDLDGTLCDTLADLTASLNYALRMFDERTCSEEQVRSFIGNGLKKQIERALPDADGHIEAQEKPGERELYQRLCAENGVVFLDLTEKNIAAALDGQLPFGFANTTPGTGHINRLGLRIFAEGVYEQLAKGVD